MCDIAADLDQVALQQAFFIIIIKELNQVLNMLFLPGLLCN